MSIQISTNAMASSVLRNFRTSSEATRSSQEKLASGKRITRAGDDAAALAISEKQRGQVRSLNQTVRNLQDGISMIQVAEGAQNELQNTLIRLRELAIQAASDTIGNDERKSIQAEVKGMIQEIDRIARSTQYLDQNLTDVYARYLEIQGGTGDNPDYDRFYIDLRSLLSTSEHLKINAMDFSTTTGAQGSLSRIDTALQKTSKVRSHLGAIQNRLVSAINNNSIYSENLSASKSRMTDTDYAEEQSELIKSSIINESALSLLGQANTQSSMALKLMEP